MNRHRLLLLFCAACVTAVSVLPLAWGKGGERVTVTFERLTDWKEKSFKGHTAYSSVEDNGRRVLHAVCSGTASGLYHEIDLSAGELPIISWSWKVARTIAAEDPRQKSGDDFAARVYVIFPGRFFWQTRALVYVYSDKLMPGTVVPSPFTANAAVIAVASGNGSAGVWRNERRNYADDFRKYFMSEPPPPRAVAVMTDGDNTGSSAEAWYGEIVFSR